MRKAAVITVWLSLIAGLMIAPTTAGATRCPPSRRPNDALQRHGSHA
jgi:hypothetical protein